AIDFASALAAAVSAASGVGAGLAVISAAARVGLPRTVGDRRVLAAAAGVCRVDVVVAAARRGDRAGRRERDDGDENATRGHAQGYRTTTQRRSLQARDQKCNKKETTPRGGTCQARRMKVFPVAAALVAVLGVARVASAGPCSALANPLVIESGDTQEPL